MAILPLDRSTLNQNCCDFRAEFGHLRSIGIRQFLSEIDNKN